MILNPGGLSDLQVLYDRHYGRLNAPFDHVAKALRDWSIWRLEDSTPVAVIVCRDGIGHIAAYGGAHVGIPRMRWAIKKLGITKTTVGADFHHGSVLARRLGFVFTNEAHGVKHYVLIPDDEK